MTILDAAEHLGVSKEAIHNRVRRGSLSVSLIDGVKYVDIDTSKKTTSTTKPKTQTRRATTKVGEDKYYKLLEEQNAQLHTKVEKLEDETRSLRDQKEEMLIQERIKIEQIYKDKDEQLKNLLSTLSSQFMLSSPSSRVEEHVEVEIEEDPKTESKEKKAGELISLKKFLKKSDFSEAKKEKIKERFKKKSKKDNRVISVGNKFYIDTVRYDYRDLIK